jgi:hypothetical protein
MTAAQQNPSLMESLNEYGRNVSNDLVENENFIIPMEQPRPKP